MDTINALLTELEALRQMFHEIDSPDVPTKEKYGWLIVKSLNALCAAPAQVAKSPAQGVQSPKMGVQSSSQARLYLAEYMHLGLPCPSRLHSAILGAACKVARQYADFHFALFLKMWDTHHLRDVDFAPSRSDDGKTYPSLAERVVKNYIHSLLLRPDETIPEEQLAILRPTALQMRYYAPRTMLVTRITEGTSGANAPRGAGRTVRFAHLIDAKGNEISCEIHALQPNPLVPVTDAQGNPARHYVNVGQLYDVLLREKQHLKDDAPNEKRVRIEAAYLCLRPFGEAYPQSVGYVESYDAQHGHYHVFDGASRHFVAEAATERLGSYGRPTVKAGDYVVFAPIIPNTKGRGGKVFKTAHILRTCSPGEGPEAFGMREAKVVYVDREKGYYRWELTDSTRPIVEEGTTEPTFTSGFVNLSPDVEPPTPGTLLRLVVYLRRGKDKQKRPRVVGVKE